jgi:hypothetical protein
VLLSDYNITKSRYRSWTPLKTKTFKGEIPFNIAVIVLPMKILLYSTGDNCNCLKI